jgi:riboflavin kinase/FMN adenylyltransferase
MEIVRGYQALSSPIPHVVLAIGNFDGVHLGHRRILELALEKARARNGKCVAYTFRPHPRAALRSDLDVQLLTTYDEKLELLSQMGVDVVIEEPFNREFSSTSPQEFFNQVVLRRLSAEGIVVGYDFAFGKERQGQLGALEDFCRETGVELTVVPPQRIGNEVVSSSRIRQHLLAGEIPQANALLGREFAYRGVVVRGDGRGRKLGFPTANLRLENKLALPYGVYAAHAVAQVGGQTQYYQCVTNVGVRPTFYDAEGGRQIPVLVETHLLDASPDLYGNTLEVRFVQRLRSEKRFSGVDELKKQIEQDIGLARRILGSPTP